MRVVTNGYLEGDFEGWDGDARFTFENGHVWEQAEYLYHYQYTYRPRAQVVENGGRYWIEVAGMPGRVEVRPGEPENVVTTGHLRGAFEGWAGNTAFTFDNGQVWKQAQYSYRYVYMYQPRARVVMRGGRHLLEVDGVSERLEVHRVA